MAGLSESKHKSLPVLGLLISTNHLLPLKKNLRLITLAENSSSRFLVAFLVAVFGTRVFCHVLTLYPAQFNALHEIRSRSIILR